MKNEKITYKGFTPHIGQRKIINQILSSDSFFHIIKAGRQWGKSMMTQNLMLYYAINNPKYIVVWTAPSHSQAKHSMLSIYNAIKNSGIVVGYNKTERKIELTNGSVLYFTGTDTEHYRGLSVDILICDEAAFFKPEVFSALLPTLAVRGKKCIMISTPRGKNNNFYRYYTMGQDTTNKTYQSYSGMLEDNPFRNTELIESERQALPSFIFNQEYLAEFVDDGSTVFPNLNEAAIGIFENPLPNKKYAAGLDIGRQVDSTVLTILDEAGKVVFVYSDKQKSWDTITNNVINHLRRYNSPKCVVEVNSIGDVVYEMLKKKGYNNLQPFTTGSNKQNLIENLIVAFENKEIIIPSIKVFPDMYNELSAFTFEYSPRSRTIKYAAPQGLHDDIVMSLAFAYECKNKYMKREGLIIGY